MKTNYYKLEKFNNIFLIVLIFLIELSIILVFMLNLLIKPNVINKVVLFSLGFILEELLHFNFIYFYSKKKELYIRVTSIKFVFIIFSWMLPKSFSLKNKMITVIFPPLIIFFLGIINICIFALFNKFSIDYIIYVAGFCMTPIFSLLPIKVGNIKSDMAQFFELLSQLVSQNKQNKS